jgi:hypothetical protein
VRGENFTVEKNVKPRVERTVSIVKIEQEESDVVSNNGGDLLSR